MDASHKLNEWGIARILATNAALPAGEREVYMKDAKTYPIELETGKMQFLEAMAAKYGLPDAGKAVRCLINYARENPDKHADMFEEVRCLDC
jgi:hypothetical protein